MNTNKSKIISDVIEYVNCLCQFVKELIDDYNPSDVFGLINELCENPSKLQDTTKISVNKYIESKKDIYNHMLKLLEERDLANACEIAKLFFGDENNINYKKIARETNLEYLGLDIEEYIWRELIYIKKYYDFKINSIINAEYLFLALLHGEDSELNPYYDTKKMLFYLNKSSLLGNSIATHELSLHYFEGIVVTQDLDKSFELLKQSAEEGYARAQYNLGYHYNWGQYLDKDINLAFHWFEKAAMQGFADAQYELGMYFVNRCNYLSAIVWFEKAANQNHSKAQCNLAICYQNGEGTPVNPNAAIYWYEKSATQNNAQALNQLATYYEDGIYIEQDLQYAFDLYLKSAELGNSYGQFNSARFYIYGILGVPSMENGIYWLEKSVEQGNELAMKMLNDMKRI